MADALVVMESGSVTDQLLRRAGELSEGVYTELIILHIVDENEYSDSLQRKSRSNKNIDNIDDIVNTTREKTNRKAKEILSELDISTRSVTKTGNLPEDIIFEAEDRDCEHIFMVGKRRSPTGKAVFGDTAQSVILNFEGFVTVTLQ